LSASTLIIGIGNPARGDDALGYEFIKRINKIKNTGNFDTLCEFQLQIEHCLDLAKYKKVLFVDANAAIQEPFTFAKITPVKNQSYTSHALSPQALLFVYEDSLQRKPPPGFLLAIRAYEFNLGQELSTMAANNLQLAINWLTCNFKRI